MDLRTFWDKHDAAGRESFAKRAGTNSAYLSQLVYGHRRPSPALARALNVASDGEIPLASLRPDLWSESENGEALKRPRSANGQRGRRSARVTA
jgi:DNA-binding transcriptional regulator YdaS (Cro superfamily)